jgi:hypothetical protein
MFDLEKSISEWRARMEAGGIKAPKVLDELESHLRDDLQARMKLGSVDKEAFEGAVQQIGLAAALRSEFMKAGVSNWNRPLMYVAWALYAVSFFLPSYNGAPSWRCASLQRWLWQDAMNGNWGSIYYELLTLANMLMLASPILFFRCAAWPRALMWFRRSALVAVLLVWSYIALWLAGADRWSLGIGCYLWATSFVLLLVATVVSRERTRQHV